MGSASVKEKLESEMMMLKLERVDIIQEREERLKDLEKMTGEQIVRKPIPDYLVRDNPDAGAMAGPAKKRRNEDEEDEEEERPKKGKKQPAKKGRKEESESASEEESGSGSEEPSDEEEGSEESGSGSEED